MPGAPAEPNMPKSVHASKAHMKASDNNVNYISTSILYIFFSGKVYK